MNSCNPFFIDLGQKLGIETYYKYFEAYLVIAVIYFIICFVLNRVFLALEKKLGDKSAYVLATEYIEEKM